MNPQPAARPDLLRGWLQVVSVVLLLEIGGVLGALTGFVPMSAILSVLLPLAAATWYLRREGLQWRTLVFGRQLRVTLVLGYAGIALVGAVGAVLVAGVLWSSLGLPALDISALEGLLEGNLTMYLWFLIPIGWGSAAIGEELLTRGFLLHRIEGLTNTTAAVVLQSAIFAVAHFYQGIVGVMNVFLLALVFSAVYLKSGRNLVPLIIAHGLIDMFSMTLLFLGRGDLLMGG